jgi:hypothetical protein
MAITRWQNVVLVVIALPLVLREIRSHAVAVNARRAAAGASAFLAVFAVQMAFWWAVYGTPLTIPQGDSFLTPLEPHLWGVLISTRHGLFSWHPVVLVGVLGLLALRKCRWRWVLLLAFVLDVYVASIAGDWWAGHGFGMRRLTGILPVACIGLAALYERLDERWRRYLHGGAVALVAWNTLFMAQKLLGMFPPGDPLTFQQMVLDKFRVPFVLLERVLG